MAMAKKRSHIAHPEAERPSLGVNDILAALGPSWVYTGGKARHYRNVITNESISRRQALDRATIMYTHGQVLKYSDWYYKLPIHPILTDATNKFGFVYLLYFKNLGNNPEDVLASMQWLAQKYGMAWNPMNIDHTPIDIAKFMFRLYFIGERPDEGSDVTIEEQMQDFIYSVNWTHSSFNLSTSKRFLKKVVALLVDDVANQANPTAMWLDTGCYVYLPKKSTRNKKLYKQALSQLHRKG